MEEICFNAFVDEFGNITQEYPEKMIGAGVFICQKQYLELIEKEMITQFPDKIHLMKSNSKEDILRLVKSIDNFLNKFPKKYYGAGIILSDPKIRRELKENFKNIVGEEFPPRLKVFKNDGLVELFRITLSISLAALSLTIGPNHKISVNFIFEESGNKKDFKQRMNTIWDQVDRILDSSKNLINSCYGRVPVAYINHVNISTFQSKENRKISELADVFAHITNRICNKNDKITNALYEMFKEHFNLFDILQQDVSDFYKKGIFLTRITSDEILKGPDMLSFKHEVEQYTYRSD